MAIHLCIPVEEPNVESVQVIGMEIVPANLTFQTELTVQDGCTVYATYNNRYFRIYSGRTFLENYNLSDKSFRPGLFEKGKRITDARFYIFLQEVQGTTFGFGGSKALVASDAFGQELRYRGNGTFGYRFGFEGGQQYERQLVTLLQQKKKINKAEFGSMIKWNPGNLDGVLKEALRKQLRTKRWEEIRNNNGTLGEEVVNAFNASKPASDLGIRLTSITLSAFEPVA